MDMMKKNKVSEEDLDQITGGRNFIDIFTAEFRGSSVEPTTLEMHRDDENNNCAAATLDMRADTRKKKKDTRKTIKL